MPIHTQETQASACHLGVVDDEAQLLAPGGGLLRAAGVVERHGVPSNRAGVAACAHHGKSLLSVRPVSSLLVAEVD
jgi:hypothetical protein